ncbi:MAG: GAF domain-containing protein [Thermomicrobiales bacterium]
MSSAGPGDDAGRSQRAPVASPNQGDVFTMEEAARLKGVSYHTVSRAVRRGTLPTTRLGRMALITQEDLHAWTPMRQRAPKRYRQRDPDPDTQPALLDFASGELDALARRVAAFYQSIHVAAAECDLTTFAGILCERFAHALELRRTSLWEIREEDGVALRRGAFGPPLSDMPDAISLTHLPGFDWLCQHDDLQVVDDLEEIGVEPHVVKPRQVGSLVVAPLRVGERLLGSLVGDWMGERLRLGPTKTHLAQIVANQAALAFDLATRRATESERDRSHRQSLQAAAAQMKAVVDVSLAVNAGADLRTVLRTAIERLTEVLGGESASIFFREAGGHMVGQVGYRMDEPDIESATSELLTLPTTMIAMGRGEPLVLHYDEASEHEREFFDRYGFRSTVIAPLLTRSESVGAAYVNFAAEGREITEAELTFAAALATQCAAAIDRARLVSRYEADIPRPRAEIEPGSE